MSISDPFGQLELSQEQQRVCAMLQKQRQCTSAELINKAKVTNPAAIIESIQQLLTASQSPWCILCSVTRTSGRQAAAPVAYYRLLKKML